MQALVVGGTVVDVAFVVDFQGPDEERHRAGLRLRQIPLPQLLTDFKKLHRTRVLTHHEASQMVAHSTYKMLWLKAFADNVVQDK